MAKRGKAALKRPAQRRRLSPKRSPARKRTATGAGKSSAAATHKREFADAVRQQAVSTEILGLISQASFDLQNVLDRLTETARGLARADMASISRQREDGTYHHVTSSGFPPDWIAYNKTIGLRPGRGSVIGRALMQASVVQVADVLADREYTYSEPQRMAGYRTFLAAPLLRDGRTIGVLSLCRRTVRPFAKRQIEMVRGFAAQAVIAIENSRLLNETRQALERQTMTAGILQVISRSPSDTQPVFDAIVQSGLRLFPDATIGIALPEGEQVKAVAVAAPDQARETAWRSRFPFPHNRAYMHSVAILDAKIIDIPDVLAAPAGMRTGASNFILSGHRAITIVPMMRGPEAIGTLSIVRLAPGPLSDNQLATLRTFADQAVIAIENARLFGEVKARTEDLSASLQQQTATADVFKVISRSTFDLPVVLQTLVEAAARLCEADRAQLNRPRDNGFYSAASHGYSREYDEYRSAQTFEPGRASVIGRVQIARKPVQIEDVLADPEYEMHEIQSIGGFRTHLGVPMLRDGKLVGVMLLSRTTVRPFTAKQIELVQTFADQALIAIENVRLFDEVKARTDDLRESLQQQTATADVLKLISRSAFDLPAVLNTLLESAVRLCDADFGNVAQPSHDDVFRVESTHGANATFAAMMREMPMRAGRGSAIGRALLERETIHILDVLNDPEYELTESAKLGGFRTLLGVPLMRDGKALGVFAVGRTAVRPFTQKQIELVSTFADQAAIAIANVRLFNETQEALDQQTAISDILRAISSSPGDVKPVFKTVTQHAARICEATIVDIFIADNGVVRIGATFGEFGRPLQEGIPINRDTVMGRCICDIAPVHVEDLLEGDHDLPAGRELARRFGHRTILAVPLVRDGKALGGILVRRTEARRFDDKHVALLTTFADQAAIAIENARLVNELRQRTDDLTEALQHQTATGEILSSISASLRDAKPVFDTIVRNLLRLFGTKFAVVQLLMDGIVHMPAADGEPGFEHILAQYPRPLDDATAGNVAMRTRQVVMYSPVLGNPAAPAATQDFARVSGFDAVIFAPMLRGETVVGAIGVARRDAKPFDEKHVALIQSFADQAVIAIENARLFNELQARTEELNEALQQQTATAEVMQVINRSAFDLDTILQTLVETAAHLCDAGPAQIFRRDNDVYRYAASRTLDPTYREIEKRAEIRPGRGTLIGRMALERRAIHILDAWDDPEYAEKDAARIGNIRTMLCVPLLRDGEPIGAFALARNHVEPFSAQQIKLVTTFADQAAIAIENVRLFEELKARTENLRESLLQQTATADVLKVISRWTSSNLDEVFETLLTTAAHLCEADNSFIYLLQGSTYRLAACTGFTPEYEAFLKERAIAPGRDTLVARTSLEGQIGHIHDVVADPEYKYTEAQQRGGFRTLLGIPMMREGKPMGVLSLSRSSVNPFTEKQIRLVETFADQAVIAIENSRLFGEVQARTEELNESLQQQTATADVLKVISRSAFDLKTVLQTLLESAVRLAEADKGTITRKIDGEFYRTETTGFAPEFLDRTRNIPVRPERGSAAGRALLEGVPVHILDQQADPDYTFAEARRYESFRTMLSIPLLREGAPLGGLTIVRAVVRPFTEKQIELVTTFADQAAIAIENARLFEEVQSRTRELSRSLEDLRLAQDRLVQTEKLASLGQLTAGIAHEIKNPLNFVNNFSAVSTELIDELNDVLKSAALEGEMRKEIDELTQMLRGNLEKVVLHGRRADSIVKNMLLHSRQGSGEHQPAEVNGIVEESLNLAYHGARAERTGFNITLKRDLDPQAGTIDAYPQEITRVLLNLISNGFYAANKRKELNGGGFEPILTAATRDLGNSVEIRIRDNGTGIPKDVREKIFNPFFTTKPAGEGTGLGLSMSHDIIVKQHGGTIDVDSRPGEFTEFIIILPRKAAQSKTGEKR